jgi:argininosuccinate synthase
MTQVLVLADNGELDIRTAIAALRRAHGVEIVTMTADIGQSRDVRTTRDNALAAGALRAHVFDAVDDFVRGYVLPALQSVPAPVPALASRTTLAYPIIAARLVEVAQLEQSRLVAHGGGDELSAAIRSLDGSLQVVTVDPAALATERPPCRITTMPSRHLLQRPVSDPSVARGVVANVEIQFDEAIPVAINGVTLTLTELLESLSLIGGEHGIGHAEAAHAPGALVLDAAYRALDRRSGVVRIELLDGQQRVLDTDPGPCELVNHA